VKGILNFEKQQERFDIKEEMARENDFLNDKAVHTNLIKTERELFEREKVRRQLINDVLIIETEGPKKRIKGFVEMDKQTDERWKVKLPEDPFYDD